MNYSKMIIAALIGAVANFLLGWVVYGMLLKTTMDNALTPEGKAVWVTEESMSSLLGIFCSCLVYSILLSYIFERWAKIRTFMTGLYAGGLIGFLVSLAIDLQFGAMTKMYSGMSFMFIDVAAATVMAALTGGIIAWFLGFKRTD